MRFHERNCGDENHEEAPCRSNVKKKKAFNGAFQIATIDTSDYVQSFPNDALKNFKTDVERIIRAQTECHENIRLILSIRVLYERLEVVSDVPQVTE